MKPNPGPWLMRYGLFLIACGIAGYLSNPAKAATALMSGGTFGALSILWGWLLIRGRAWSRIAATVTTALLVLVFTWRAGVSWMAVAAGTAGKLTPAILITLMGAASLATLVVLFRSGGPAARPDSAPKPAARPESADSLPHSYLHQAAQEAVRVQYIRLTAEEWARAQDRCTFLFACISPVIRRTTARSGHHCQP